jgi:hypothetical protein
MMRFPICHSCLHLDRSKPGTFCAAFPAGIPRAITDCKVQHREPYPGDRGLQYQFDPDWSAKARAALPVPADSEPDLVFG